MAIEATITGNLGADPEVRWTRAGQQVTELRICATPRRQRRGPTGGLSPLSYLDTHASAPPYTSVTPTCAIGKSHPHTHTNIHPARCNM